MRPAIDAAVSSDGVAGEVFEAGFGDEGVDEGVDEFAVFGVEFVDGVESFAEGVSNQPRSARQVHPVHQPVEGQTLSAAALLSALELENDEENRPAAGSPGNVDPDDGEPYTRTIIR